MSRSEKLDRLAEMAAMLLDARTYRLRQAAAARDEVVARIADLDAGRGTGLPATASDARVAYAYDQWASARRAALNIQLAARLAECDAVRDEARLAFGKARVIGQLGGRARDGT